MTDVKQEELFDIYDDNLEKIGVKPRSQVHRDGDWHRSFHCNVIYRDAQGKDWMVLQKRAPDKDTFPNCFDVACGGHYSAGEDLETTALRELDEELGLKVAFSNLIFVGIRISMKKPSATTIDREVNDIFFLVNDQPLTAYQPNDELSGLALIPIDDGLALCAGERQDIDAIYLPRGVTQMQAIKIGMDDYVATFDQYLYRVLVSAKRCLNGEKYLVI
ncbi:MAG TPA: NUDIX domain-containing protein [Phototrophicaceae bacterium]|jgi:isopentenyldiphosphate isomerase|nr:NUDIX domain-containing protein [Phototrophicaceae bacterium]